MAPSGSLQACGAPTHLPTPIDDAREREGPRMEGARLEQLGEAREGRRGRQHEDLGLHPIIEDGRDERVDVREGFRRVGDDGLVDELGVVAHERG